MLEHKASKPDNENVEIAEGLIVTMCVRERLRRQAESEIPHSKLWRWTEGLSFLWFLFPIIVALIIRSLGFTFSPLVWVICFVSGFLMIYVATSIGEGQANRRIPSVVARIEELARERQKRIDEALAFYSSSEWRLKRIRIVQRQGRLCQECKRKIKDDFDLTVDHIKPRSKFPELALEESNLRVLCRRCNSSKGSTYEEVGAMFGGGS